MKLSSILIALICCVCVWSEGLAQNFAPPESQKPDEAKLKAIQEKMKKLDQKLAGLRRNKVRDSLLAEVEIFQKAAEWIVRHDEFYHKDAGDWTLEALDIGLLRASQAAQGAFPWLEQTGHAVVRAYRSVVDGSLQPYAVVFPHDFGKGKDKVWRLDIVLHGRDASISEVKFIHAHNGEKPSPKDQQHVQIDIYGRGNNAYRWAGEMDIHEVVDNFLSVEAALGRIGMYDPARRVLRGFSMGGAGSWHLGLHYPDRWCAVGPGAGFTTTHGYVSKLPEKLPAYQEACLHIYDAVDYSENAANVPVIAYGGTEDPQLQAAKNIEAKLTPLGIPMTLLVAPGVGHTLTPEFAKKAEELYAKTAEKGRDAYPKKVHFVTWTAKYPSSDWVNVLGLVRHYERTQVSGTSDEKGFQLKTTNVRQLALDLPPGFADTVAKVDIDGQKVEVPPPSGSGKNTGFRIYLENREGKWSGALPEKLLTARMRQPQKANGLQGPIDDAFMYSFLCVIGTGKPWHENTGKYAEENLKRFLAEWDKYFRGELLVKKDVDITSEDLAVKNLILFGDPSSNSLISQVLDGLPLQWTKDKITLDGKTYAAGEHVPALIYPSPLNTGRYVVLNSGHTFRAADFKDTNAMLFPRLGDYAVLKLVQKDAPLGVEIATAGLFDDFWRFGK